MLQQRKDYLLMYHALASKLPRTMVMVSALDQIIQNHKWHAFLLKVEGNGWERNVKGYV